MILFFSSLDLSGQVKILEMKYVFKVEGQQKNIAIDAGELVKAILKENKLTRSVKIKRIYATNITQFKDISCIEEINVTDNAIAPAAI